MSRRSKLLSLTAKPLFRNFEISYRHKPSGCWSCLRNPRCLTTPICRDIQSLRCANDMQQNETADMASKSQAVLNMNLKLQNTAVKSQARLIASEVAKFELAQAEEQLHIVQVIVLLDTSAWR